MSTKRLREGGELIEGAAERYVGAWNSRLPPRRSLALIQSESNAPMGRSVQPQNGIALHEVASCSSKREQGFRCDAPCSPKMGLPSMKSLGVHPKWSKGFDVTLNAAPKWDRLP
ncbi:MAG: hypothetical protein KTR29_21470 [Rhodothermaceae bacterium]|nr:hypothetical protein [Rhodothermaceae bacterium]